MKTQVINGNLVLNLGTNRLRTARQRWQFDLVLQSEGLHHAQRYLKSFAHDSSLYINSLYDMRQSQKSFKDILRLKKPGHYMRLLESFCDPNINHSPNATDKDQWIGVEIECIIPNNAFGRYHESHCEAYCDSHDTDCDDCGCDHDCQRDDGSSLAKLKKYIKNQKIKYVSVKTDGSIKAEEDYFGAELTVLFKRGDRSTLKKLCDVLNKLGAKVNKSCGMHVHLDQRDLLMTLDGRVDETTLDKRGKNLERAIHFLSTLVPVSRRTNNYCNLGMSYRDRYHAINMTAFKKYKTIEVRLHSSTTDFEKINNWIDILLIAIESPERGTRIIQTLNDFCAAYNVPEKLIAYMEHRIKKFSHTVIEDKLFIEDESTISRDAEESDETPLAFNGRQYVDSALVNQTEMTLTNGTTITLSNNRTWAAQQFTAASSPLTEEVLQAAHDSSIRQGAS